MIKYTSKGDEAHLFKVVSVKMVLSNGNYQVSRLARPVTGYTLTISSTILQRVAPAAQVTNYQEMPARLAQSVERETLNLKVAGSTPALGSIPNASQYQLGVATKQLFFILLHNVGFN
ncbi:hypothetical protein GGR51DRAFT_212641 [Nemania sp. FL0031]|nr:hypothetical protein GGR51DRAFT_212641 [Nemania sp. FL0031]